MASIFTKIINGELPCYKILEDDLTISFLALDQVKPGHTLVVPKIEVNHWYDTPRETLFRVQENAAKIAKALSKVTDCPRVLTAAVGFEVPHYHLHLIPAWGISDLNFANGKRLPETEMKVLQQKIVAGL